MHTWTYYVCSQYLHVCAVWNPLSEYTSAVFSGFRQWKLTFINTYVFCLGKTSSETFKRQQSAFKDYCLIWHSGIWAIPLKCKTFEWYCCFNSRHWSSEDDHRQIRSYHLPHQWDHCAQEITQTEGHLTIKGCWNTIAKEICKWDGCKGNLSHIWQWSRRIIAYQFALNFMNRPQMILDNHWWWNPEWKKISQRQTALFPQPKKTWQMKFGAKTMLTVFFKH